MIPGVGGGVENFILAFGGGLAVQEREGSGGSRNCRKGNAFVVLGELEIVESIEYERNVDRKMFAICFQGGQKIISAPNQFKGTLSIDQ